MTGKQILILFISFAGLLSFGVSGYTIIEGWSFLDSLYMTFTTLSTVGYGEVHVLSDPGRIFTIFLILAGVGQMAYFLSLIFKLIIDTQFNQIFRRNKMKKQIAKLKNHTIICGYGKMGHLIAKQMRKNNCDYVILEKDPDLREKLEAASELFIIGNASMDSVLEEAGIEDAKVLVTTVTTDAENVFITLTANSLNKNVRIISRVFDDSTIPKLVKAGASKIISPYTQASMKIAQSIINPAVDDFLEVISSEGTTEYQLAEIKVEKNMFCAGKTLEEIKLKEQGMLIVSIKRESGERIFAPHKEISIELEDQLILIGTNKNFSELVSNITENT